MNNHPRYRSKGWRGKRRERALRPLAATKARNWRKALLETTLEEERQADRHLARALAMGEL